jgi:type II secretory pathway component PulC
VEASSRDQAPGDESRYKLEAIVWSSNEESRFAVINGQIVRRGGAVGGLSVVEIARDHVEVRSGGRDWKMRFTVE